MTVYEQLIISFLYLYSGVHKQTLSHIQLVLKLNQCVVVIIEPSDLNMKLF